MTVIDIGARVYTLAANSAVYREVGGNTYEWIHSEIGKRHEFVKHEDYVAALKLILELQERVESDDS